MEYVCTVSQGIERKAVRRRMNQKWLVANESELGDIKTSIETIGMSIVNHTTPSRYDKIRYVLLMQKWIDANDNKLAMLSLLDYVALSTKSKWQDTEKKKPDKISHYPHHCC